MTNFSGETIGYGNANDGNMSAMTALPTDKEDAGKGQMPAGNAKHEGAGDRTRSRRTLHHLKCRPF